jgi:hypothetical protein
MSHDYVLEIHYADADEPIRVELLGYTPDDAEAEREALIQQIEDARVVEAPLISTNLTSDPLAGAVTIEVDRVSSVDLLDKPGSE